MKNVFSLLFLLFVLFLTNCTAKNQAVEKKTTELDDRDIEKKEVGVNAASGKTTVAFEGLKEKADLIIDKETKEAVYFAASLEREALKLIHKKPSYDATTMFQVLSFILEIKTGTKKTAPLGLDCSRFDVRKTNTTLHFLKTCQSPHLDLAEMEIGLEHIKIVFKIKEWASVVGSSVALTQPDVVCHLGLKNKKISQMSCQNWAYVLKATTQMSEEIRLTKMIFSRDKESQFELEGGFFSDLIERRHLKINVPLQGSIKRLEKELEVRDDFADLLKAETPSNKGNELNEIENKNKEKSDQKNSEKDSKKETEETGESSQREQSEKIETHPQTNPSEEIIKENPFDDQGEKNENAPVKSRRGRGR